MAEYIDRDAILEVLEYCDFFCDRRIENGAKLLFQDTLEQEIRSLPAADVRPVVRGRWIFDRGDLATCSNCGSEILKRDVRNHKFCHYCGADMRVKEDGVKENEV